MDYVKWLEQIRKDDIPIAGGKGANLGEMISMRMPVPEGFVITTKAFNRLLELNNLGGRIIEEVERCNVDDTEKLLKTSEKVKKMIVEQEIPSDVRAEIVEAYRNLSVSGQIVDQRLISLISAGRENATVAVRSSATAEDLPTASFAGQQLTFLNVRGQKELIETIKKCWASLYEPRAIFYRAKNDVKRASIAVIVQRMVNSEKSGVMFTINPTTGEDVIVIEAIWGLGELIVSGQVTPDLYIVDKEGKILEKKIGRKTIMRVRDYYTGITGNVNVKRDLVEAQVLNDDEIKKLVYFGKVLEDHYQRPQDIEFAIERGLIRIVQTRAVTAIGKKSERKIDGKELLKGLGASPGIASGRVKVVLKMEDITKVEEGDILVTTMTSPDLVPTMSKAAAIVTDLGGSTSHAAIVSREMGIPAIVGTGRATKILKDGQIITIDAYTGTVYAEEVSVEKPEVKEEIVEVPSGATATKVKVNLAFAENLEKVSKSADGVGLLRIEHMITKAGVHPAKLIREGRYSKYTKILVEGIKPIAEAFKSKPIWVRTLDARSDEFRNLEGGEEEMEEDNPMLGWHGIRRSLDEPNLLRAEFDAIKQLHESDLTNVHIMFPFIISVDEFRRAREIANESLLPESVKLGIMIETPAAALTIDEFCKEGIDFVSLGTNDLTQLTLGIDRNNSKLSEIFSEFHPAVLKMMRQVIETCNRYNIESSICGESGSNPKMAEILVKYGIGSISCNIDAIDKIRATVFKVEKEILNEARKIK